MNRSRISGPAASFLLLILAVVPPAIGAEDSEIAWMADQKDAFRAAEESGKPLLVDVWAVWCGPCKTMEAVTFSDERVIDRMRDFVALKVDADANEIFAEAYRADILPTTLVLDADGAEITRFTGFVGPDDLVETMRRVRSGYAEYRDQIGRLRDPIALEAAAAYLHDVGNDVRAVDLLKSALKTMRRSEREDVERLELRLAQSLLHAGDSRAAAKILERLSEEGVTDRIRGRALQGLVIAHHERGREDESVAALERLRRDFPDLAQELGEGS